MQLRVYATLRPIVNGSTITLEAGPGDTFRTLLDELSRKWPALKKELFDTSGQLSTGVHVFLNGRDIRYLGGLDMVIPDDAEVRIFPPVGGGR